MDNQRELIPEEMEQITGGVDKENFEHKKIRDGEKTINFYCGKCPDCGHSLRGNACLYCCICWDK